MLTAQNSAFVTVLLPAGFMVKGLAFGANNRPECGIVEVILNLAGANRTTQTQPVGFGDVVDRYFNELRLSHDSNSYPSIPNGTYNHYVNSL